MMNIAIPKKAVFDFSSLKPTEDLPPLQTFSARDGTPLSYRSYESSFKENVFILLHGSGSHGAYLDPLAQYLASNMGSVYLPNLRGHYASGEKRGDCSYVGQLEDDLADLIDTKDLSHKKIFLIGHSSGGGLAIRVAGGAHGDRIQGFVLLSPAIPTSPSMRLGTAGGWANPSIFKIVLLSIANALGISRWNHIPVISFNMPEEVRDGTETLSYTYNLNTSYHPRIPYQKDLEALRKRAIIIIGAEDEANDPLQYSSMFTAVPIQVLEDVKHMDIVRNQKMFTLVNEWVSSR